MKSIIWLHGEVEIDTVVDRVGEEAVSSGELFTSSVANCGCNLCFTCFVFCGDQMRKVSYHENSLSVLAIAGERSYLKSSIQDELDEPTLSMKSYARRPR